MAITQWEYLEGPVLSSKMRRTTVSYADTFADLATVPVGERLQGKLVYVLENNRLYEYDVVTAAWGPPPGMIWTASTDSGVTGRPPAKAGAACYRTDKLYTERYNVVSAQWIPDVGGLVGRNRYVNGEFAVSQRGNGTFTTTGYGVDLVYANPNGSTYAASRQTFTSGEIPGAVEAGKYLRVVATSVAGAGNYVSALFPVESVANFAGQQVVVSFWAKADAVKSVGVEAVQSFGTGGAPSAFVSTPMGKQALTTGWVRYSLTVAVPTITAKVLGTNGNDYFGINVWFDCGATNAARSSTLGQQSGTFDIWGLQIEQGFVATAFEPVPVAEQFVRCRRYFQRFGPSTTAKYGMGVAYSATNWIMPGLPGFTPMRAAPAFAAAGAAILVNSGTTAAVTAWTSDTLTATTVAFQATVAAGLTNQTPYYLQDSGAGTLTLDFSAEF